MNVKDWLRRARIIEKELNQLSIAKQEAYDIATGISVDTTKERTQGGPSGNSVENKYINLLELDLQISRQKEKLWRCKTEILEAITMVEDARYRTLLIAYYVNCKSWEEVAVQMNYGIRQVYRLHGAALRKIKIEDCLRCH